jgi:hypothetical protein
MSLQYNRLSHRFSAQHTHGARVLIAACRRNRLTDQELAHLCDRVFTEVSADAALEAFLASQSKGDEHADAFLLSLIPPRSEPRCFGQDDGLLARFTSFLRSFGRFGY